MLYYILDLYDLGSFAFCFLEGLPRSLTILSAALAPIAGREDEEEEEEEGRSDGKELMLLSCACRDNGPSVPPSFCPLFPLSPPRSDLTPVHDRLGD